MDRMTAAEAADHQWLKPTDCNTAAAADQISVKQKWKETRSQEAFSTLIRSVTNLDSSEKVGEGTAECQRSKSGRNWLSSSHPFVSVCLSMEEDESLEISRSSSSKSSRETTRKSIKATHHPSETTHHLSEVNHLSLSSTPSPAITCPLLTDQKGDMVAEQEEEKEEKVDDPTDNEESTIAEQIILQETIVPEIRGNKNRRKRARDEASNEILDAKKKRPSEDTGNFGAKTEKSLESLPTGFSKIRRGKRRKGRIAQHIKMQKR